VTSFTLSALSTLERRVTAKPSPRWHWRNAPNESAPRGRSRSPRVSRTRTSQR
jgi:hypothetical protein